VGPSRADGWDVHEQVPLVTRPQSLWQSTTRLPAHGALRSDIEVDVVVVGAGITGLTAALLLKRAGWRVAVLEAGTVGKGVTSFTTAHITEALDTRWFRLSKDFGRDAAAAAARSQRAAIERIAAFVAEEQIECAFRRLPGWLFAEDDRGVAELEQEAEAGDALGLRLSFGEPPLPFPVKAALRFDDQAQFHPLRYLAALATGVQGGGSFIADRTRVLEIEDGEPCRVRTEGATIVCRDVFVATHSPVNDRMLLQTKLAQYRSYVVAARGRGSRLDGLFWDTADPYHYVRSADDESGWFLIVGGADHKVGQKRDTAAPYRELRNWVRLRFSSSTLDSDQVEHQWSAQVVETVDGLPYVGRNPKQGHVWVATGYAGNGMTHGTMAAMLVSDLICGRRNEWADLYDPARIKPVTSFRDWIKQNIDYPLHLLLDRLKGAAAKSVEDVRHGEGRIVEIAGERLALHRDDAGAITALSPVCTHMGCEVGWNPAERSWDCPCHGGRFAADGQVLDGPPNRPLARKQLPKIPEVAATGRAPAIVRQLGLAAAFGGMLFGKMGLDPAVNVIKRRAERGRLVTTAWTRWTVVGAAGMVAAALASWTDSFGARGRARRASLPADALFAIACVTGALNAVCGLLLARTARDGAVPLETGLRPGPAMTARQRRLHRTMVVGGWTQLATLAGTLALEATVARERKTPVR
jgi:glycine/D-amino acid oxidase-like deaminating enzyme/nitrite reductase/ring-hydroxylating ferredoxin subunit